jgi:hypothetical protein
MPYEYIYANITVTDGSAYAEVNGTYPFLNAGYQNVSMSYPLPDDATDVSVWVDENTTSWSYTDQPYATVFGDLPVINWTIDPAPNTFTVEVDYEHSVPMRGQNFTYFYAMGTWKGVYVKQMTAYVTADITMDSIGENETLEVYAYQTVFNSTTQEWVWKQSDCVVSRIDNTFHVTAVVQSDMFRPIEGDFLLTFKKAGFPELLPTDLNEDGVVNMVDLTIVAVAFTSKPGDKNWNVIADLDGNSEINILDISLVAKDYGKSSSCIVIGTLTYASTSAVYVGVTVKSITPSLAPHLVGSFVFLTFDGQLSATFPAGFAAGDVVEILGKISFDTHSQIYVADVTSIIHTI